MIRVAIDSGTNREGDQGRGIGFHTKLLIDYLQKFKDLEISLADTNSEDLSKFDIIHYPGFDTHHAFLPPDFPAKTIITVHDVIKLIYPKAYPLGIKGKLNFFKQKRRLQKANAIITISETSKKDIVRLLGIKADKIDVVYLAPQPINTKVTSGSIKQTKQKYNLPDRFVLYVGGVNYNKNLITLAMACKLANIILVMVGKETTNTDLDKSNIENKPWSDFLEKFGQDKDVLRLGFLSEEELSSVWRLATIYCQPSLYEGFGLPILEAFEHKVPVIASRTQALMEVGDNACLYFDPKDKTDLARRISKLCGDKSLQDKLIKLGAKRVTHFSWEKTAEQTYEIYKKVANF